MIRPLSLYRISSGFGNRIHPISKVKSFHKGIDYVPLGDRQALAIGSGVVVRVGTGSSEGNYLVIKYDLGYEGHYYHLKSRSIERCHIVKEGTIVGIIGTTGNSTGVHLHFGWKNIDTNKYEDFEEYFRNFKDNIEKEGEEVRYINYESIPEYAKSAIRKVMSKGYLKGDENGKLDITESMIRMIVINDRAGLYDR